MIYTDIKAIHLTLLTDSGFLIKSIIISCEREKEKEKWFQTERSSSLQRGLINICQSAGRSAVELLMWQCPAASVPANYQWTHRRSVLKCPGYCYRGSHQINVSDWLQRCCAFCSSPKTAVRKGIVLPKMIILLLIHSHRFQTHTCFVLLNAQDVLKKVHAAFFLIMKACIAGAVKSAKKVDNKTHMIHSKSFKVIQ